MRSKTLGMMDDDCGVRTLVIVAVMLVAGGCDAADGPRLISPDVAPEMAPEMAPEVAPEMAPPGGADGCVVRDGEELATHRVARGETLSSIARDVYGVSALWPEIARANPGVVDPQGNVEAGALLVIPFEGQ
jgi:nucleoid-associated protein YgaU